MVGMVKRNTHDTPTPSGMSTPSYRTELPDLLTEDAAFRRKVDSSLVDLKSAGVLVPDTRLQDIADAWNEYLTQVRTKGGHSRNAYRKLVRLLDALTEENAEWPVPNPGHHTRSPFWDALVEETT